MKTRVMFVSVPLRGHTNQLIALAEELALRDHFVSFVIHQSVTHWITDPNIQVIPWRWEDINGKTYAEDTTSFWQEISQEKSNWRSNRLMIERAIAFYEPMYESFREIMQREKPDCLVVDRAVTSAIDVADHHHVPCIIQSRFLGHFAPVEPHQPQFESDYSLEMNIWQKCLNYLLPKLKDIYLLPTLLKLQKTRKKYQIEDKSPVLFNRTTIVGTSFEFEIPRPVPENVHVVGPIFSKYIKSLDPLLKAWIESSSNEPILYVAFGTLSTLNAQQISLLITGLMKANIRVLWSLSKQQQLMLPQLPETFRIESFVPQFTVLSHPKITAFMSHCGMNSINESLYCGKPILAFPFFGDQPYNAARLLDLGVAVKLNRKKLTATEIQHKIMEIVSNPVYRYRAKDISDKLQKTDGLAQGASIIETFL